MASHLKPLQPFFIAALSLGAFSLGALPAWAVDTKGPTSSQDPYVVSLQPDVSTTSLITVGDSVNLKANGQPYRFVGIPDGMGAFDNGDGTFTALINHELRPDRGAVRDHGGIGAFVSRLTIRKDNLAVTQAEDLIQFVSTWNTLTSSYNPLSKGIIFNRFCSADLPAPSAFFSNGVGYRGRLFMNGEEAGDEGRAFAHSMDGNSYELPRLGKFSWENSLANPATGLKTVVAGTDDSRPGQVYIYIGTKTNFGSPVQRAGLTNGLLYGVKVAGFAREDDIFAAPRTAGIPSGTRFSMEPMGNSGNVENQTGAALQAESVTKGVTEFLRPEDGQWDAKNPRDFYFVTTDRFDTIKNPEGTTSQPGRSRLYRLRFDDLNDMTKGGVVDQLLDGTERQQMMDNMTISEQGELIIQEDPGSQDYLAKIHRYNVGADTIEAIAEHNPRFFAPGAPNFLTRDEESSGVIDISDILGRGTFLINVQAHYATDTELVEGGQLLVMRAAPPNEAPVAVADSYEATEDTVLTVAAPGVLANDTDVDNNTLSAAVVTQPTNGTLVLNANGSFTYTPNANFNGTDSFTYRASDGTLQSAPITVTLNVRASNDAPQITLPTAAQSVAEDGTLTMVNTSNNAISVSDVDTTRLQVDVAVTNGTLTLASTSGLDLSGGPSTGESLFFEGEISSINAALNGLRFVPRANFSGTARLTIIVNDGSASTRRTLNISVGAVNDAPVAVADNINVLEDTSTSLQVLGNDSDPENSPLSIVSVDTANTRGTVTIAPDRRSVIFTPASGFNGSTSFGYTISDGALTATARVTVQVSATNDAPVALDDTYTTPTTGTRVLQVPASRGVLANDTDADGNTLRADIDYTRLPRHGRLILRGDGSFTYAPSSSFSGRDTFFYRVDDGQTPGNFARVTINVPTPRDVTAPFVAFTGGTQISRRSFQTPRGVAADRYAVGRDLVVSSGLRNVVILLQNASGQYWNGRTFQRARFELAAGLNGRSFSLLAPVPTGALAPQGTYRFTAIARDNAGNSATAEQTVTIESTSRG
jgi:VCBS repeat-containing protein